VQCMSRHGGFPAAFMHENSRGAPARALLLSGVVASVMLLTNFNGLDQQGLFPCSS